MHPAPRALALVLTLIAGPQVLAQSLLDAPAARLDERGRILFARGTLSAPRSGDAVLVARAFLRENRRALGLGGPGERLELADRREGIASRHVRFRQLVRGLPVHEAEVSVHLDAQGVVRVVHNETAPAGAAVSTDFVISEREARSRALELAGVRGELRAPARVERLLASTPRGLRAAFAVTLAAFEPLGDWVVVVDAADASLHSIRNDLRHATGSGCVFHPDPVRSSGDTSLEDRDDRDQPELTAELVDVVLENLDGSGYVRGAFADARSSTGRAFDPNLSFHYTRSRDHFEEVNFYYHVDRVQAFFEELGILGANRRRQVADVHGTSADNSYYSPTTKKIVFGDGGVDDAEDGDIILHEYGHAIQDNQVPGWGRSHESGAMGEGFGDWLAAAFFSTEDLPEQHDAVVGDWDATTYSRRNPPALRRVDGNKIYPRDMEGSVHQDGEIWSRGLWDLRWRIGRADAMRLVLESHFFCSPDSDFFEGAMAIVAADEALFAGRYRFAIRDAFVARGILAEGDLPIEDDERCRAGDVVGRRGTLQDILTARGSAGEGWERVVAVDGQSPISIALAPPGGQEQARFVLYAFPGAPSAGSVSPLPFDLGLSCFAPPLVGGAPLHIWNNWGRHGKAGTPDYPSAPAPSTMVHTPAEVGLGDEVTLQGFIENHHATGRFPASVTNALLLRAR